MTVREAFERAGYPIPEEARIVINNSHLTFLYGKVPDTTSLVHYAFTKREEPDGVKFSWTRIGVAKTDFFWGVDLSRLPAKDAYFLLPEVIRNSVEKDQINKIIEHKK